MRKDITCVVCPLGCVGAVEVNDGKAGRAEGFSCQRGCSYAAAEVERPQRMLTTTVRVLNGENRLVPVVSSRPLPKGLLREGVRLLSTVQVPAPLEEGQIIYRDLLGSGVDIIASRAMAASG